MEKFATKKSLGQNFLNDKNIILKILETAEIDKQDNIVEIGPGLGALTDHLILKANKVLAIELDNRLIDILTEKYQKESTFKIIHKDFLKTNKEDFQYVLDSKNKIKVVANLPYYITTPIILKILLEYDFIDEIYIMVQKEVAQRYTSEYKNKEYGSISVFLQTIVDLKYEFTVKKTVFTPQPKIDSAIISLKRKEKQISQEKLLEYEKFLKICFKQKRKLLSNNLSQGYKLSKEEIIQFIEENNYTKNLRPEELTVEEYGKFYKNFMKEFKNGKV